MAILIARNVPWRLLDSKSDEDGRWLGLCYGKLVTFATIYVPNEGQTKYIEKTIGELMEFAEGPLILGGDLNLTLNPDIDTSRSRSAIGVSRLRGL